MNENITYISIDCSVHTKLKAYCLAHKIVITKYINSIVESYIKKPTFIKVSYKQNKKLTSVLINTLIKKQLSEQAETLNKSTKTLLEEIIIYSINKK